MGGMGDGWRHGRHGRYGDDVRSSRRPEPVPRFAKRLCGKKKQLNRISQLPTNAPPVMIPRDQHSPLQAGPSVASPAVIPRTPDRNAPPTIQPQAPAPRTPRGGFVTTTPNQAAAVSRTKATDRYQYWWNYYRTHEESSADLKEKVTLLNVNRKFQDVHAVLLGYLTHYAKTHSEPWMYEALALAIEMNKGDDKSVRLALKYAADKAEASRNPNAPGQRGRHAPAARLRLRHGRQAARRGGNEGPAPGGPPAHVDQPGAEDQGPEADGRGRRSPALAGLAGWR